jgi:two-component system, response regulator RegA
MADCKSSSSTPDTAAAGAAILVDRDASLYNALMACLGRRGWRVARMDRWQGGDSPADVTLALVDVCPEGVPDLRLISRVRRSCPHARLWAVTSYPSMDLATRSMRAGADLCIAKPVYPAEIMRYLEEGQHIKPEEGGAPAMPSLARFEWEYISRVLSHHQGNISATARTLRVQRSTLQRKLKKHPPTT